MTVLGPPDTLYEGGFFNAVLKFPRDYPQSPPDMRFTSEMWCVRLCSSISQCAVLANSSSVAIASQDTSKQCCQCGTNRPIAGVLGM